jgi:hypothetical protein
LTVAEAISFQVETAFGPATVIVTGWSGAASSPPPQAVTRPTRGDHRGDDDAVRHPHRPCQAWYQAAGRRRGAPQVRRVNRLHG